jgi:hypothetical protein
MRALAIGGILAAAAWGQGFGSLFDKAPPHIEEALRARITFFYQSHVDGKFRQADQAVHEDSKDVFFGAEKRRFKNFKILTITYEENYTKARVSVDVGDEYIFLGAGKMPVNRAVPSFWKLDNGQWWWYVTPYKAGECKPSPFGGCLKETETPEGPGVIDLGDKLGTGTEKLKQWLATAVKANKNEVALQSVVPSSDEITITNDFDAAVTLQLDWPEMDGLSVKLDKDKLEPKETAKLTIVFKPLNKAWKPDLAARVWVQPTNQAIPIKITFIPPPKEVPANLVK